MAAPNFADKTIWTLSPEDEEWMISIAESHAAVAKLLETSGLIHGKGMQSYLR